MTEETNLSAFEDISVVVATDCGSTTTKAVLFEKLDDGWHQTFRGEAPTTVEKPVADVTIGVQNAFRELEELSGRKILKPSWNENESPVLIRQDRNASDGVDLYVSTSSAGGGLQMVVAGVVGAMTTASAERAALGAGAIVMDAISLDDGREQHERVQKIRHLRPDIVLLAGGTEGGTVSHPLELAETVLQASPRPRFGETLKLPVIYAANSKAKDEAQALLAERFAFTAVGNIRPSLEEENIGPARDAIHELFLHHVMSHAPGYRTLLEYTPVPIIPTPAACGLMVQTAAQIKKQQILAVDIGGATTDVFSVCNTTIGSEEFTPVFNRTVSANLGMSYSIANVLLEAGLDNIIRWLPFSVSPAEICDRLRNKMIRPTSIPHTHEDLLLEQAICREALRLAFIHHKRLATGLKGAKRARGLTEMFKDNQATELLNMLSLDLIIGSGGVLSHAPDRKSSALMLIDAYQPTGITRLAVDSIFMMPHLGVFSTVNAEAAVEIFLRDCIVELGTVIAPEGATILGKPLFEVALQNGTKELICGGELKHIPLGIGEEVNVVITPKARGLNFGAGLNKTVETNVRGGHAGLILDGRGRQIQFATATAERPAKAKGWYQAMDIEV